MELKNKVCIITGSSKGIGLALVKSLLHKGAKVAGWSRTAPEVKHENFRFFSVDVRKEDSVAEAYEATVKEFGKEIHVLVNNAGLGYAAPIEEMSSREWQEMFEVNVHGIFYCSQRVIPEMKRIGEGHIVNISSIAGKDGSPLLAGYCGTKFAVRGISQSMYKELRDYGVKVTVISPGSVQTQFFENIEHIQANENMMKPEDVAASVIYALETSTAFHPVEIEVRPLMPNGRKKV